jgi:uncharacterized protein
MSINAKEENLHLFILHLGGDERYLSHVTQVSNLAVAIARAIEAGSTKIDIDAVYFGAMLHDIGRIRSHEIDHGIQGVALLNKEENKLALMRDFNLKIDTLEKVFEAVECHIVGGIQSKWIREAKLGIPEKDYIPKSIEAKIVAYSDQILHGWDEQTSVFREAPQYDLEVYKQFYSLSYDIIKSLFLAASIEGKNMIN